jgi:predicted transposase YbfD/YdcC
MCGPPSPPPSRTAFPPYQQKHWREDARTATTRNKGHGRVEVRTITTTTWLNGYLDWPHVGQVFRLRRQRRVKGTTTVEVVYGITSLGRAEADAGRLLELTRLHWAIENRLHYVRDVTFREDPCRVRKGEAARVLASLRNVAIHLLRTTDHPSVAAATRTMAARPDLALNLLHHPNSNSA